jgi:hypothetical protein
MQAVLSIGITNNQVGIGQNFSIVILYQDENGDFFIDEL